MSKELTIIIAGKACTGKSTMMIQLEKLLKENGYNVELSFDEPFNSEREYYFRLKHMENNIDEIERFKSGTKITLKEMQLAREPIKTKITKENQED